LIKWKILLKIVKPDDHVTSLDCFVNCSWKINNINNSKCFIPSLSDWYWSVLRTEKLIMKGQRWDAPFFEYIESIFNASIVSTLMLLMFNTMSKYWWNSCVIVIQSKWYICKNETTSFWPVLIKIHIIKCSMIILLFNFNWLRTACWWVKPSGLKDSSKDFN